MKRRTSHPSSRSGWAISEPRPAALAWAAHSGLFSIQQALEYGVYSVTRRTKTEPIRAFKLRWLRVQADWNLTAEGVCTHRHE